MNEVVITIPFDRVATLKRILLKAKSEELSDLRRVQTQLVVYGDRRRDMAGEPAAIGARMQVLEDLLAQIEAQAGSGRPD